MKRLLPFLLLLSLLSLSIGCKEGGTALETMEKPKATINISPEGMVPANDSSDEAAKVLDDESATASDEIVKKDMNTKPTAKVSTNPLNKSTKSVERPVKKPKPNPVRGAPTKYLPKVEFDEISYDFGEIVEGDIIKHNFTFTNVGKNNLSIKKATATCGCTKPSFPFIDIKPGETGYIGVTYNSVNKNGPQKPEITVFSNALRKEITLYLTGSVKPKSKAEKQKNIDSTESMTQDTTKQ